MEFFWAAALKQQHKVASLMNFSDKLSLNHFNQPLNCIYPQQEPSFWCESVKQLLDKLTELTPSQV